MSLHVCCNKYSVCTSCCAAFKSFGKWHVSQGKDFWLKCYLTANYQWELSNNFGVYGFAFGILWSNAYFYGLFQAFWFQHLKADSQSKANLHQPVYCFAWPLVLIACYQNNNLMGQAVLGLHLCGLVKYIHFDISCVYQLLELEACRLGRKQFSAQYLVVQLLKRLRFEHLLKRKELRR